MHWAVKYIGKTPEEIGFCWGLLRAVYAEQEVGLPAVEGLTMRNADEVAAKVRDKLTGDWVEIEEPQELCAVAMSQAPDGQIHHVGVYTSADGGRVVHCWGAHRVIAEDFRRLRLKGFKIIKFYRHKLWPS